MRILTNRRGQSTGEYAILFGIVLGAVVMMQVFIRNSIAGGLQGAGNQYRTNLGALYTDPAVTRTSDSESTSEAAMESAIKGDVKSLSTSRSNTQ